MFISIQNSLNPIYTLGHQAISKYQLNVLYCTFIYTITMETETITQ
jgi:hypothetical protein